MNRELGKFMVMEALAEVGEVANQGVVAEVTLVRRNMKILYKVI